ncbi:SAF domain-containing protein [Crossiella sp. SN42]|uniref:SAF domain-containing protein n=1 Tax=Crossiella sp. SN42 TaxID=2944808 RepID=UPI00207CDCE8|nr:SAF domain-containing protein [Crossiella sp. SN42]MCO1575874.1 SAF domain-containing protein [Crossiella sp. SN42]
MNRPTPHPQPPRGTAAALGDQPTGAPVSRLRGKTRRHRLPHLVLGILLVVACTAGGVVAATRLGARETVLALARPVQVGHVLTEHDLQQVDVGAEPGHPLLAASDTSTVLGQPVAFTLPAGTWLTRALLGTPRVPPHGTAIAAIALKPGQFPPELTTGATVLVLATAPQGQGATATAPSASWSAVVGGVAVRESEQTTVVSLHLAEADARAVAAVPAGQLAVVAVAGGGR